MYENVFNRVEQKYILSEQDRVKLFNKINKHLRKDIYYDSLISNIYFDGNNNESIINSLEKPLYKDKVRLRSYGIVKKNSKVFFEIKNKYKGVVGKRRIMINLKDYYDYLDGKSNIDNQIMKEIDYLIKHYKLKPAIMIAYHRFSYVGLEDNNLRITFDNDLTSRRNDLRLENGIHGEKYFKNNETIMEIKTLGGYPLWLSKALSELKIFPNSFSKYGSIYSKEVMEGVYA
ncbi:MAG: polyphosphate polymerase domain-containing protein [Bacilli bacterium]|nr:polyphosphate polymerase domain-containing protein [Bacilli bacterium]